MRLDIIASKAGVSMATVSRVLNKQPGVAVETRERVLTALFELTPPMYQTLLIGLIIPDGQNPLFTELAYQLNRECERRNATLIVMDSDGRADRELEHLVRLASLGIDGLLLITTGTGHSDALLRTAASEEFPILAFDRGIDGHDRVTVDSRKGTEAAVDHLVGQDHRRIGYLHGLPNTETADERFHSFKASMAENRLEVKDEWVFPGDYKAESGRRCADQLIAMNETDRPTAMLAANDVMAIALMQKLQEAGWRLPHDLSIIGFDNIPGASLVHPRLTTIEQPIKPLVRDALSLLTRRIAEKTMDPRPDFVPEVITIQPVLRPRSSVDWPRGKFHLHAVNEG